MTDENRDPPYARYAFSNPYNLTLLGGAAASALLTGNWWIGMMGLGLEALWMVFAPDSRLLRAVWFDKTHERMLHEKQAAERARAIGNLPGPAARRVQAIFARREQIWRLCGDNQSLEADLLKTELKKLDTLTQAFLDLQTSTVRYEQHLATVDLSKLERELRENEARTQSGGDSEQRKIAQKNLALLMKRRDKLSEIGQFVSRARGQMDLTENTFQLLADQIVTLRSPKELSGQLDDLIDGVEAIRSTARETESLMETAQ
jgi:hypothetical protein